MEDQQLKKENISTFSLPLREIKSSLNLYMRKSLLLHKYKKLRDEKETEKRKQKIQAIENRPKDENKGKLKQQSDIQNSIPVANQNLEIPSMM